MVISKHAKFKGIPLKNVGVVCTKFKGIPLKNVGVVCTKFKGIPHKNVGVVCTNFCDGHDTNTTYLSPFHRVPLVHS